MGETNNKAFEVASIIISEAAKTGRDIIVAFQEFLDCLIDTFSIDKLNSYKCDYQKIFDLVREQNPANAECLEKWIWTADHYLKKHECIDFFGEIYERIFQSGSKAQRTGQYFTPPAIFDQIAEVVTAETKKDVISINEPTCGSGRGLLSMWQKADWSIPHVFFAEDLDPVSVKMCALNMMINGMYGFAICHDTLLQNFIFGYAINEVKFPLPFKGFSIRKLTKEEYENLTQ